MKFKFPPLTNIKKKYFDISFIYSRFFLFGVIHQVNKFELLLYLNNG